MLGAGRVDEGEEFGLVVAREMLACEDAVVGDGGAAGCEGEEEAFGEGVGELGGAVGEADAGAGECGGDFGVGEVAAVLEGFGGGADVGPGLGAVDDDGEPVEGLREGDAALSVDGCGGVSPERGEDVPFAGEDALGGEGDIGGLLEGHGGVIEEELYGFVCALLEFEGDAGAHVVEVGLWVDGGEDEEVVGRRVGVRLSRVVAGGDGVVGGEGARGDAMEAVDVAERGPAEPEEVCGVCAGEEHAEVGEAREGVELLCPEREGVIDEELEERDACGGGEGVGRDVVDVREEVEPEERVGLRDGLGVDGVSGVAEGVGEFVRHGGEEVVAGDGPGLDEERKGLHGGVIGRGGAVAFGR